MADITTPPLTSLKGKYPDEWLHSINDSVSWLVNHNNITYKTEVIVPTDSVIMSNRVDNIFKLGLIDITKPSDGLIYYDIKSIESVVDEASNTVIFKVWCSYKTAVGNGNAVFGVTNLDASKSSSVYGKSTTVQPKALRVAMWIRVK